MQLNEQNFIDIFSKNFDKIHSLFNENYQPTQKKRRSGASKANLMIFFDDPIETSQTEVKTDSPLIQFEEPKIEEENKKNESEMKKIDSKSNLTLDSLFEDKNQTTINKRGRRGSKFFENSNDIKIPPSNNNSNGDLLIDFFSTQNNTTEGSMNSNQNQPIIQNGKSNSMLNQKEKTKPKFDNEFNSQYTLPTMVLQLSTPTVTPPTPLVQRSTNSFVNNEIKKEEKKDPFSDLMWK